MIIRHQWTFEMSRLKIILEMETNDHGTLAEAAENARRCLTAWARVNGFDVKHLSVQTRGYVWVEGGQLRRVVVAEGEQR